MIVHYLSSVVKIIAIMFKMSRSTHTHTCSLLSHAALYRKTKATIQLDESLKYRCARHRRSMCVRAPSPHATRRYHVSVFML